MANQTEILNDVWDPVNHQLKTPVGAGGSGTATTPAAPGYMRLEDGATTNLATVAAFHNSDNQVLPANSYGLNTGGVAQLLNAAGNIDRQRETGFDGIPAAGVATGTQQLAAPFSTTVAANVAVGTNQVVTPASMTGIQLGTALQIANSNGTNLESVFVSSVTATTFTAGFALTKTGPGITVKGFTYNQARDATIGDKVPGLGLSPSATYLFNGISSLYELDRSASGELDGATGQGTAVAAEYENSSGGPALASGLASGLQFDRARNLNGKGRQFGTITTTASGNTSIVLASATASNLVQPGSPIVLSGGATSETVYATGAWVPGSSATVPLQSPVVNAAQTTASWDVYAAMGPGLAGFNPSGIGIEEEALYDPLSNLYYIERSATQDNVGRANVVLESEGLVNSNQGNAGGIDSARANLAVTAIASAAFTTTQTTADQLNVNGHALHVILDVTVVGTGSVTLAINAKDPASGKYYPLLTGVAVVANSTNVYRVGPALTAVANAVANDWVPRLFQIVVTANNANAATYSVGYNLSE